jgi:hypothetical protein
MFRSGQTKKVGGRSWGMERRDPAKVSADGTELQVSEEFYSAEEALNAWRSFSDADWAKFRLAEAYFSKKIAYGDDIITELYKRISDGRRKFNKKYCILSCLCGSMRSIAYELRRDRSVLIHGTHGFENLVDFIWSDEIGPERKALSKIINGRIIDDIEIKLGDEPLLLQLYDAVADGLQGTQICQKLNISQKQLASLRRRLKRRLKDWEGCV